MLDSALSVRHFYKTGVTHYQPNHIELGGVQVYLPDFQVLWHPHGLFLNSVSPIRNLFQVGSISTLDIGTGEDTTQ
jgi:hypothetical protein